MITILRVLVIEDSEDDALLVLHKIKEGGYDIDYDIVDSAPKLKAALKEKTWDIILSDYAMPHFNGLEALSIVKESGIDIPFIVVSGTIGEEVAVEAMKAGAHDYLMKNNLKRLLPAIERELQESKSRAERKHAEDALFEGQQVFRTLVENSPDIIARYDYNCQRIYINPTYLKTAQIPEQELLSTSPDQRSPLPPASATILNNLIKKVLGSGVAEAVDVIWPKDDNINYWYNIYASPEFDREGNVVSVMTTSRDITIRKHAEEQVLRLNRIYAVLSNINKTVMRLRNSDELLNEACRIAVGYGRFKMAWIGKVNPQTKKVDVVASHGFKGDYLEKINIDLNDELRSSGPTGLAVRTGKHKISNNVPEDDKMIPWKEDAEKYGYKSVAALPLIVFDKVFGAFTIYDSELDFFHDDDINLLDEVAGDISFALEFLETEKNRKKAENDLIESEERYRLIAENTVDTISVLGLDLSILYVSPSVKNLCGYTAEEVCDQTLEQIFTPESMEKANKLFADQMALEASGKSDPFRTETLEVEQYCKDGSTIWVEITLSFIRDIFLKPTRILTVTRDITQRKLMEMDLLEAKEKAEEMSRLKSSLLLNMSHELRTPMNGILGFSSLLKEKNLEMGSLRMVDFIYTSGLRLMTTLNSIMELAEVEAGKQKLQITPVHLSELIQKIALPYIHLAENKKLKFNITVKENLFSMVDERLLHNILHYLLDNAIKFTDTGSISLILKKDEIEGNSFASIIIIDSGIGIPSDKKDLIFDAFRQGSEGIGRSYEGTGLGLTLSKKFVELLNGVITVDSIPDIGSTFSVRFPLYVPSSEELIASPPVNLDTETVETLNYQNKERKARVLIVEDNEQNCELMEIYLSPFCSSDSVPSGKQAIKQAFMNQYDLILMDINLGPEMDGIQATKEIRKLGPYKNVPIIAVTGFSTLEEKTKILSAGIDQLLTKPFTRDELVSVVRSVIRTLPFESKSEDD